VQHTAAVGAHIYTGLERLAGTTAEGKLLNLRGKDAGTFIAFDAESAEARDKFVKGMRSKGVIVGGSGEKSIRLRPMLYVFSYPSVLWGDVVLMGWRQDFRGEACRHFVGEDGGGFQGAVVQKGFFF
jgi:hypothetical protein